MKRRRSENMSDDEWVKEAMIDDTVVVDFLLRLFQAQPPLPKPVQAVLRLDWTVRQRRSKSVPRHGDSTTEKKAKPMRASPTTPLSWSSATSASGGALDGFEESSRLSKPTESLRFKAFAAMEGNIITWNDGWDYLEKGIIKMKRRLEGLPEPPFKPDEYRIINTMVQKMCTQMPPHDYSRRLYDEYRKVFEEYMIKTVLRSLAEKHDESLLRELKRKWQNNKEMVTVLSRFFHFLNRYFIARRSLPALNEVGLTCFRDLVYEEVKANARNAVISLIDEEREGQQIDRTLLKDVIDIYVKIGMGQMGCYRHDFEADMLRDSGAYYSHKASNWIVDESCNDYISKTDDCLQRERDRVTHYLHISSEQKLVKKVQYELLVVYARHLLRDDKVEDLTLLYKYYHEILSHPISTTFKLHVTAKGTALVQQVENDASSEAANGVGVQLRVPIRKITEMCQKYKEYVNGCFLNHSLFDKALKEAFEVICNTTDAGSAELLSMLCNDILKKGGSEKLGDEAIEETLKKYSEEMKQKFKKLRRETEDVEKELELPIVK